MTQASSTEGEADTTSSEHELGQVELPAPVPPWIVLVVDDDPEYLSDTVSEIRSRVRAPDGNPPEVVPVASFSEGMNLLSAGTVDVVVLDVREEDPAGNGVLDEDRGVRVFERLKGLRFLPVVFFTAVEGRVEDQQEPPLVQVVSKAEGSQAAADAVATAFASGAPTAVRALGDHVREVMRQYLWDHVGPKWKSYGDAPRDQLANLLVGRLAKSLEHGVTTDLRGALGDAFPKHSRWHPSQMYVLPPLTAEHTTGDLVQGTDGTWSVLLTPACDLVVRKDGAAKAERLLLATARPLFDMPLFMEWQDADRAARAVDREVAPRGGFSAERSTERKRVQALAKSLLAQCRDILRGSNDRYFHLPAFLEIPDLLVDLQYIEAPPFERLSTLKVVASLNPPYAQALLNRFVRYVGRVGLDDPDVDWLLDGFRRQADAATSEDQAEGGQGV
ncbi:hypothetical protein [Geodermatophilus obscurus]|uniref:Uncharacterized protein n=1 Tax=Geodermatophilus obscurus (strain ATCC 25078 / DSM 43160 / JCM 3152 / CCUG 61914 / KCC A-0152 / KCTC 9177 / NBRC 13315 / NRRL B-3577 / G-20) TaxID=526225 RepID=D2S895_GEOOG|nr:hypothetical protein [Geodermatophilus obscurus]ADB73517.1 hypothetical protein Gobs_0748 [Geodermatophilus obscurus DSM 43160]